ncbi:class I SAM-dependent methyltransferase [Advenella sp. RU8]|uniref:class I SAM-dependent methyltransferase n=1 Tax=Advenella sp. RU8 TaxID=3399575 RepID=UPI003AB0768A
MNTNTASTHQTLNLPDNVPASVKNAFRLLSHLQYGKLIVVLPNGQSHLFGTQETSANQGIPVLHLHNWNVCSAVFKSGDIGFAETYIAGDWSTSDLPALLTLLVRNRQQLSLLIYGNWLGRLAYRIRHLLNRNTRSNSRKNIHAHYDLGNEFYSLWLDKSMNYSSALFDANPEADLETAQWAKVKRALDMVQLKPGDRLLEIGCGWGALAEMAAVQFKARPTGVTLSSEQLAFAQQRMERLGMATQADLRLQDYRDINDEAFDAICSIEMIEAVGKEYWPVYFQSINRLLKQGGRACIQSIVIDDELYERYINGTDFIQQYIFPGGCLPSTSQLHQQIRKAGLKLENEFSFGQDYAKTCKLWREDFLSKKAQVTQLGFDENFMRTWEFYLAYCEAAFTEGSINVMQLTLVKE